MKYMQTGGFQGHPLMRLTLSWALVFLTGLWITNGVLFVTRLGLSPKTIEAHYLGSAEEFSQPRSAASMLEVTHAHLPIMGIVLLTLTHLLIFSPYSDRFKRRYIAAVFSSALLGEASGYLVRFVHPGFAYLKLACFLVFQSLLGLLILGLAAFLKRAAGAHKARH